MALDSTESGAGAGQMTHFVEKNKLNMFRLPVAWQYLVNGKLGGTLDATAFGSYDKLMKACLATGAHCIIDIHNYARWNGQIIGQPGGPTKEDFSSLWKQLATKYAAEERVGMGLINEPHDSKHTAPSSYVQPSYELIDSTVPNLASWAGICQAAVTAIRGAGATSQMIFLPGNGYTAAGSFVSGGSAAALAGVTNPDRSTTNLIFEVHQYLDSDGSGTHTNCVKGAEVLHELGTWLKNSKRQALLAETGGGSENPSCITNVCALFDYMNENSDAFLGYLGWAAGSFAEDYVLSLVPQGGKDVGLMEKCFAGKFGGGAGVSAGNSTTPSVSTSPDTPDTPASPPATGPSSASSAPAGSPLPAPTSSSAPASTSSSVLTLPPSGGSITPGTGSGAGQNIGGGQQPGGSASGPDNASEEQDDCDAEWEDVPAPAMIKARNGKVRWNYEGETRSYEAEVWALRDDFDSDIRFL